MSAPARPSLSAYQLRHEGWLALTERLGVSGAIRFLMQYDPGYGDYTEERRTLFADLTMDQAIAEMEAGASGRG
jgi:hypothetical protein